MGTIIFCLQKKKPILTLPRLAKLGEIVNDHQYTNAMIFSEKKYIYPIFSEKDLIKRLKDIQHIKVLKKVPDYASEELISFLKSLCN